MDHDAKSLAGVLKNVFEEWKIRNKVFGTTDNSGNIVNACVDHLNLVHVPHFGETLQLSIKRALDLVKVQRVVGRCRKCVGHFNKSTKETYKLHEKQEQLNFPVHQLAQDCVTQWGSTLQMLERIQEQQAGIAAVLMEGRNTHFMPEGKDWKIIDTLISVLGPFQKATEAMSGEAYPTISITKPLLHKLLNVTLKTSESDFHCMKHQESHSRRPEHKVPVHFCPAAALCGYVPGSSL